MRLPCLTKRMCFGRLSSVVKPRHFVSFELSSRRSLHNPQNGIVPIEAIKSGCDFWQANSPQNSLLAGFWRFAVPSPVSMLLTR